MGEDFRRDSIYNGLWTRSAVLDAAAGGGWGQEVMNDITGFATEEGLHAQTGVAIGGALGRSIGNRLGGSVDNVLGAEGKKPDGAGPGMGGVSTTGPMKAAGPVDKSLASLNSPATRHYADKVTQTSVAKEVNTVIDRSVIDVLADVTAIRSGKGQQIGDTFLVNGRTYGMHDGTLYPMSGTGLYTLDRGGYKALGVLNKFGNTPQAEIILKNMGISPETKAAALVVFEAIKK
jgi:hypothetical protein